MSKQSRMLPAVSDFEGPGTAPPCKRPVDIHVLVRRINRVLTKQDTRMMRPHPCSKAYQAYGGAYIAGNNGIVATQVDLAAFARELGVLKPWEVVAHG
jgi:hypothetical protein